MTRTFLLYHSSILLGRFTPEGEKIRCTLLVPESGEMGPEHIFTPEENAELLGLTKLDVVATLSRLEEYGNLCINAQGEWTPSWGGQYTQGLDGWYIQRQVKFPCNLLVEEGKAIAFQCPNRESVAVLVEEGQEERTSLALWQAYAPAQQLRPVECIGTFQVLTRDGVELSTNVFLPADRQPQERFPAVLVRTPYGKEGGERQYHRYIQRGYAVVVQDVRGRNESGGRWQPFYHEIEDGDDTLSWIAAQSWSDGGVGMIGGSYLGYVQWAAAASGNPHLKAMISVVTAGSAFVDMPRRGGTLSSGSFSWAFAVSEKIFHPEKMEREDWDEVLAIRPLAEIPCKALGYEIPFLQGYLDHPDYDDFWRRSNWKENYQGGPVPALIQSGWFDDNGMGTSEALDLTHDWPKGTRKVVLGPWQHSGNSRYDLHGLDFGPGALRFDLDLLYLQWLDHFLKGVENGVENGPVVEYYTTGQEAWKNAENWPVPAAVPTAFYLDSDGDARTSNGNGRLTMEAPAQAGADTYRYDPENPGTHIIDMSENEVEVPEDYTLEEQREDYLCYTGPVLEQPLTITGDGQVELFLSSDAPDTDVMVRICDVFPGGRSMKLADGVLTAKYREGFEAPVWLEPGQAAAMTIRTTKLSHTFLPGHRLRVTITSGAKNFMFPHSNTKDGYDGSAPQVAQNTIHHGGTLLSRILLPVEK